MAFRLRAMAFALAGFAVLASYDAHADEEKVAPFLGTFVGSGTAENLAEGERETRDLDVTVTPFQDDGFTINWITVILGESGDRTGPDVKRREVTENFLPVEDKENLFVLAPDGGLFQKSETPDLLSGEAVRWAAIDGNTMIVYSLAIEAAGSSELQVFRPSLTQTGMDISFVRLRDDEIVVRMKGELVRTN